jgi:hypothetical protein
MSDGDLAAQATVVGKNMPGNPAFTTPPVDLAQFNTRVSSFIAASAAAALDKGNNAKALRDQQRKLVIQDLHLLAIYVQNNCKDDTQVFVSSGFQAKSNTKQAPQPAAAPVIRKVDYGPVSGQLLVFIKSVRGARTYYLRHAPVTNGTPGTWTQLTITNVRNATVVGNLTPGTTYAFEAQALGPLGYSDWSDSSTCMCT